MKTKRLFLFGLSALLLALSLGLAGCDQGGDIKVHNTTSNRFFFARVIGVGRANAWDGISPNRTTTFYVDADGTWDVVYYDTDDPEDKKTKSVYISGGKAETVNLP
jgi:hypothetical protein